MPFDCQSNLPTIPWNGCRPLRGIRAHYPVEHAGYVFLARLIDPIPKFRTCSCSVPRLRQRICEFAHGEVAEWSIAPVSKTGVGASPPWVRIPPSPPNSLTKTAYGPYRGLFLFWFQRGLAVVTALQRLQNHAKLVSEPDLSLTDRPRPSQGRFKKIYYFQWFDVFGRACHSKVQPSAQFVSKPRDGRRAVDVGGKETVGGEAGPAGLRA